MLSVKHPDVIFMLDVIIITIVIIIIIIIIIFIRDGHQNLKLVLLAKSYEM